MKLAVPLIATLSAVAVALPAPGPAEEQDIHARGFDLPSCLDACSSIDAMEKWCDYVPWSLRIPCEIIASTPWDEIQAAKCRKWCRVIF